MHWFLKGWHRESLMGGVDLQLGDLLSSLWWTWALLLPADELGGWHKSPEWQPVKFPPLESITYFALVETKLEIEQSCNCSWFTWSPKRSLKRCRSESTPGWSSFWWRLRNLRFHPNPEGELHWFSIELTVDHLGRKHEANGPNNDKHKKSYVEGEQEGNLGRNT